MLTINSPAQKYLRCIATLLATLYLAPAFGGVILWNGFDFNRLPVLQLQIEPAPATPLSPFVSQLNPLPISFLQNPFDGKQPIILQPICANYEQCQSKLRSIYQPPLIHLPDFCRDIFNCDLPEQFFPIVYNPQTFTAVPEPGTAVLFVVACVLPLLRFFNLRRKFLRKFRVKFVNSIYKSSNMSNA